MIFYFSATGNSAYAARRLAELTDDRAVSIEEWQGPITLSTGEKLGFVTPTYFLGLPSVVSEWLESAEITVPDGCYVYIVATYGTTCGQACGFASDLLAQKEIAVSARFSIQMPDTWTPTFDLSNRQKVEKAWRAEPAQIEKIAAKINAGAKVKRARRQAPMKAVQVYRPNYERARRTKYLWTTQRCVGCGKCAENCPVQAIEMQDGKPFWKKHKCAMCLRCLHNCPVFALQYSTLTMNHGQYTHPEELSL